MIKQALYALLIAAIGGSSFAAGMLLAVYTMIEYN